MYFVRLFKGEDLIVDAPFESRDKALKYYNNKLDVIMDPIFKLNFDRAEIWNENLCLFDYEVSCHV